METPQRVQRRKHLENLQQQSTPLRIPPSPFMKNLGYGTGVNVYRLERDAKDGQMRSPWAVKKVTQRMCNTDEEKAELLNERIREEANILRKLSHPNIIGFRGISKDRNGIDALILECCKISLGSILEERFENDLGPLPAPQTLKMIGDVAHGLDYLHTSAKLLHGDLKSFNVLVKGDFEICKLCDFGVSLPLDDEGQIDFAKNSHLAYVGTNIWSAPEIMDEADIIDAKADIFSFGLIIYETIALVPPHTLTPPTKDEEQPSIVASEDSMDVEKSVCSAASDADFEAIMEQIDVACGTRPPLPQAFELSDAYNVIVELFYCCTAELPEDRPTAKIIWQSLQSPKPPQAVETNGVAMDEERKRDAEKAEKTAAVAAANVEEGMEVAASSLD